MSKVKIHKAGVYEIHCPGCDHLHNVFTNAYKEPGPKWYFNGDMDKPTFSPSLLNRRDPGEGGVFGYVCHSFIKNGRIEFFHDSTHALKGKTVELPEIK